MAIIRSYVISKSNIKASNVYCKIPVCMIQGQTLSVSGLFHDMVMDLSRSLNFTPNFVVPKDGQYGNPQGRVLALFSLSFGS